MKLDWLPPFVFYLLGIIAFAMAFRNALFNKNNKRDKDNWKQLLENEHSSQFVRNKELPNELFLKVDFRIFPVVEDVNCQETYFALLRFNKTSMVNLKNYTNLELKSNYGPQVIEKVSSYERNYFEFMDILYKYGKILYENHYIQEARMVLEQGLYYRCDLSKSYILLIKIYHKQKDEMALSQLRNVVQNEMQDSPFFNKILEKF